MTSSELISKENYVRVINMHPIEHNLDNHSNYRTKTRLDKIKHLRSIANRESICYHESGHTVMSILLHG